jgi:hypothetical protein
MQCWTKASRTSNRIAAGPESSGVEFGTEILSEFKGPV